MIAFPAHVINENTELQIHVRIFVVKTSSVFSKLRESRLKQFGNVVLIWCTIIVNLERWLTNGDRKVFSEIDSPISLAYCILMINLGPRAFTMFELSDDGKEPGTRCKKLHDSLQFRTLSRDTYLVFNFTTLHYTFSCIKNMASIQKPYLVLEKQVANRKIKYVSRAKYPRLVEYFAACAAVGHFEYLEYCQGLSSKLTSTWLLWIP